MGRSNGPGRRHVRQAVRIHQNSIGAAIDGARGGLRRASARGDSEACPVPRTTTRAIAAVASMDAPEVSRRQEEARPVSPPPADLDPLRQDR